MPGGSVSGTVTRVAAFEIHHAAGKELHTSLLNARGDCKFGTEVIPDVFNELANGESTRVLIALDNGLELNFTRSGEKVTVDIWPMMDIPSVA